MFDIHFREPPITDFSVSRLSMAKAVVTEYGLSRRPRQTVEGLPKLFPLADRYSAGTGDDRCANSERLERYFPSSIRNDCPGGLATLLITSRKFDFPESHIGLETISCLERYESRSEKKQMKV
ncbi:hypothetical protein ACFS3C_17045 [Azotobacter vinelandii]